MKTALMMTALLVSVSASAMEIEKFSDPATGDTSALIKNPTHYGSNLPLSGAYHPSDENGVCKLLGYEKAALGSARIDYDAMVNTLQIERDGYIISGPSDYPISQIVCLNQTNSYPNERSVIVSNPTHADSRLPFSGGYHPSSENGVCVSIGYRKVALHSERINYTALVDAIQVNETGSVIAGPSDYIISQIVCITTR
jgi:hypothetical protein